MLGSPRLMDKRDGRKRMNPVLEYRYNDQLLHACFMIARHTSCEDSESLSARHGTTLALSCL